MHSPAAESCTTPVCLFYTQLVTRLRAASAGDARWTNTLFSYLPVFLHRYTGFDTLHLHTYIPLHMLLSIIKGRSMEANAYETKAI